MWFHVDWYEIVIITKTHPTTEMKSINWTHLEDIDIPVVAEAVSACENMHLQPIMSFSCHWNEEVVALFYATLYVDRPGRKFHWML
jgi:hypothetical protein